MKSNGGRQAAGYRRRAKAFSAACRLSSVVLVLLVCLGALYPHSGVAFAQLQKPTVTVDQETATPHFPDTIDFSLRAHGFEASRADLNYRLVGDPVTDQETVKFDNSTSDIAAKVTLDLSTHYIPPGASVVYYWTLTGDASQPVYSPQQTFTVSDDRYHWQTLTDNSKKVSVHWYDGDKSFGQSVENTASEALGRLQTEINGGLDRPADVWVYSTQDDLLRALPKNIPEWVGGKAFPELSLVLAAIAPDFSADEEVKRVVPHELSHLVLYQATNNPYNTPPAWMDEGLAVHNQEAQDPAEEDALKSATEQGRLIPLKSLSGSFGADPDVATLSYAESRSVMDFVLSDSRYGPQKFAQTVAAFRQGVTYDDALKAGLGITVDELDRQWRASLPYQQAQQAQPGQGAQGQNAPAKSKSVSPQLLPDPWGTVLAVSGLGLCTALFIIGGVLTLIVVVRRRPA